MILIGGGLFLLCKSTQEIWESLEGPEDGHEQVPTVAPRYWAVLGQIAILDIVFSLDSVITAVGMAEDVPVMVIAIVIAVGVMMLAAKAIGDFVDAHPSVKMLALSFLILVGVVLVGEGHGQPHQQGLHLLRDGVLGVRGGAQHALPQAPGRARAIASAKPSGLGPNGLGPPGSGRSD